MGRTPRAFQPNAVLQSAIYSGLAALVRLARGRVRSKEKKYYKSIASNWLKAWTAWEESKKFDPYDYSAIQNSEPNLRGAFFKVLWNSTKRYGNKETKRIYSWEEGTVGPLNALLNYAGARLRDLGLTEYQFPNPVYYEVRVYADGTTKVIPKSVAEKYPDSSIDKTYIKAGYPGNQYGPRILLSHPTLPGLDFVDMIRAHLIELCKYCFIYNVPRSEAHRYIRLLIHRLRPYLDWVYSQGATGKKNFNPESDRELREIVQEIKALHGRNVGKPRSVSESIERRQIPETISDLRKKIAQDLKRTRDTKEKEGIQSILDHIDQGTLQDEDVKRLKEQILSLSQQEGNNWHRILLSNLHHPVSLKQVVFAGERMLEEESPILIVGELPIGKRTGQIDLTFFLRREIPGRVIMTPMMIVEIKSKTGFNYNLYSIRTRNKKKKDYGPRLHAWKRKLTDNEWNSISKGTPAKETMDQLAVYEQILIQDYKSLVSTDPTPPESLWKGVIVLDTDQDPSMVFDAFQDLLSSLIMALVNDSLDTEDLTSFAPILDNFKKPIRLAFILTPSNGPSELVTEMQPLTTIVEENPFRERIKDGRILTLYVSVPSQASSGNAAAWLSRNWHLLHHIQECTQNSNGDIEIHWLDLVGVFREMSSEENKRWLINRRFGLDNLLRDGKITQKTHKILMKTLERIEFIDLSIETEKLLSRSRADFSELINRIRSKFDNHSDTEKIIVLNGWPDFRDLVPKEKKTLVRSFERTLLDILPNQNTNLIWIDHGMKHTRMNSVYQRRCIKPLSHDSPRLTHLDEIIYNVPTTPRVFGWRIPRKEDARIIIQDTPTSAAPWIRTIDVPLLRDFSKKVRGTHSSDGVVPHQEVVQSIRLKPMYGRGVTLTSIVAKMLPLTDDIVREIEHKSMTLIPSILRERIDEGDDREQDETEENAVPENIEAVTISALLHTVSLTERTVLVPAHPPPSHPKAKEQYHDARKITRRWNYDAFPKAEDEVQSPVPRPPIIGFEFDSELDTIVTREQELKRLLYAAQFLIQKIPNYDDLYHNCERIIKITALALSGDKNMQKFLRALQNVRAILQQGSGMREVWDKLVEQRKDIINLLNSENRRELIEVLNQTPDLLELYGNNLMLTILVVVQNLVPAELTMSVANKLWIAVMEWELYQLGFKPQQSEVRTRYDLQAIYANLCQRTMFLRDRIPESRRTVIQEYGQIRWSEEESVFSAWIVFQDTEKTVGGFVEGFLEPILKPRWYECVKDRIFQRNAGVQGSSICTPIITEQHENTTILWVLTESDDNNEPIWIPYELEYPTKHHRRGEFLHWLRISFVPATMLSELQHPNTIEIPSYVERNVNQFLESVRREHSDSIKVTCLVSMDTDQETYEVGFYEGRKLHETLKFKDTKSLVRTLRTPVRHGSGIGTSDGSVLMWNHRTDIEYIEARIRREKKTDVYSLSILKPLVHRSKFFPEEFYVPSTCLDFLSTKQGEQITMKVLTDDNSFRDFRVELDDVPEESYLKLLETLEFNIFDLALLAESEQLVDPRTNTRHDIELDVKGIRGLRFSHIDEYQRLKKALSELEYTEDEEVNIDEPEQVESSDESNIRIAKLEVTTDGVYIIINQQIKDGDEIEVYRQYVKRDELDEYMAGIDDEYHPLLQHNVENLNDLEDIAMRYLNGEYPEDDDEHEVT
ncbi:MAG: hypothetical protein JW779_09745 [Candidatus Thorarchaeota archaeon]|nr:hypothetical protein [Candidatus Thorarchaeota archaeon]